MEISIQCFEILLPNSTSLDFKMVSFLLRFGNRHFLLFELVSLPMTMVMNLYSAFSIEMFKCALQASDLWVRSDSSIYIIIHVYSGIRKKNYVDIFKKITSWQLAMR